MQLNAKTVQLFLVQSHRHTKVFTFSAAKDDRLLLTPAELKSLSHGTDVADTQNRVLTNKASFGK